MSSVVEICNAALTGLGAELISSLEETSEQAIRCNLVWNTSRRAVLRLHPWKFAIHTEELARLANINRKFRYDYSFRLPADYIRLLRVYLDHDYKLEGNVIYTNSESCKIKYVYDNKDTSSWDSAFTDLMSAKVQKEIAYAITRDKGMVQLSNEIYFQKLIDAQVIGASEDIEDPIGFMDNDLIGVRY